MPLPRDAPPSLHEFLCHARARRRGAIAAFALVFLAALGIAAVIPPSYKATATLAVLPAPEFTVRSAAGSHDRNQSALALDQIMKAETAILDSDDLHGATLRAIGAAALYPDIFLPPERNLVMRMVHGIAKAALSPWRVTPADKVAAREARGLVAFESDFTVLPTKDANIITVSLDNPDGKLAAAAVNALLGLYAARRSTLYVDPQLAVVRKAVTTSEAAAAAADGRLAAYKQAHGISDAGQQRDLLLQRVSQARHDMADAAGAAGEQQARVETLTQQLRGEPATVGIFREQDPDTRLQAVNASLQDLQAKLAAARLKYLDGSRVVSMLEAQIAAEQAEAARLGHDPASSVVRQGRNPNLESLRLDRARAAAELAAAQARVTADWSQLSDAQAALDRLDAAEIGLLALQRAANAATDDFRMASTILAERHLSEAEDLLRLANVRVIQPALVPQFPRPLPILVIAAGFMLGLMAAFARIVGGYVLHPVFLTAEGLEMATGLPVLAMYSSSYPASESELVL